MSTTLGNATSLSTATEQPLRYGWSQGVGPYTIKSYRGTRAAVEAKIPELVSLGYSYEVIQGESGALWTIEARAQIDGSGTGATAGNEVTEKWEIQPNKAAKDLLSSNCAVVSNLGAVEIQKIRDELAKDHGGVMPTNLSGNSLLIYKMYRAGADHWMVHQPILRHAISIPLNWTSYNINATNIGKILTSAQLYSLEGMPSSFIFNIGSITDQLLGTARTDDFLYTAGWYKGFPTMEVTSQGRRDVSIDYEFGLWVTTPAIYTAAS